IPEVFFGLLTEGYLTLAEAYLASIPHFSWKMVLIGDPLYRVHISPVPEKKISAPGGKEPG
ncbi:MAG: hypothetical protein CSA18_05315, partial [Deltaproteobacteria bacterium]